MSILLSDIKFRAAAVTPEDDVATAVGGAIDLTKKYDFADVNLDTLQAVSSAAGDTTQSVAVTYRDATGVINSLNIGLNGLTPVANAVQVERLLKAVKNTSCAGDVAIESATAVFTGTLTGTTSVPDQVVLPVGASGADGFYNGMVFRVLAGAGLNLIFEIIDYVGATRTATLNRSATALSPTTGFRISRGIFFDKTPTEVMYVVRMDYNSAGDAGFGVEHDFYQKGFFIHTDASASGLTYQSATVKLGADGTSGSVSFAIGTALNDLVTNGVGNNRQVAPVSGVTAFSTADKNVPGAQSLQPTQSIAVWMKLQRLPGAPAVRTSWTPVIAGLTV